MADGMHFSFNRALESLLQLLRYLALIGVYAFVLMLWIMMYGVAVFLPQRLGELGVYEPVRISMYMALITLRMSVRDSLAPALGTTS